MRARAAAAASLALAAAAARAAAAKESGAASAKAACAGATSSDECDAPCVWAYDKCFYKEWEEEKGEEEDWDDWDDWDGEEAERDAECTGEDAPGKTWTRGQFHDWYAEFGGAYCFVGKLVADPDWDTSKWQTWFKALSPGGGGEARLASLDDFSDDFENQAEWAEIFEEDFMPERDWDADQFREFYDESAELLGWDNPLPEVSFAERRRWSPTDWWTWAKEWKDDDEVLVTLRWVARFADLWIWPEDEWEGEDDEDFWLEWEEMLGGDEGGDEPEHFDESDELWRELEELWARVGEHASHLDDFEGWLSAVEESVEQGDERTRTWLEALVHAAEEHDTVQETQIFSMRSDLFDTSAASGGSIDIGGGSDDRRREDSGDTHIHIHTHADGTDRTLLIVMAVLLGIIGSAVVVLLVQRQRASAGYARHNAMRSLGAAEGIPVADGGGLLGSKV